MGANGARRSVTVARPRRQVYERLLQVGAADIHVDHVPAGREHVADDVGGPRGVGATGAAPRRPVTGPPADTARSTAPANRSVIRLPATRDLSAAGEPSVTRTPRSITMTRSASWSTSSR